MPSNYDNRHGGGVKVLHTTNSQLRSYRDRTWVRDRTSVLSHILNTIKLMTSGLQGE